MSGLGRVIAGILCLLLLMPAAAVAQDYESTAPYAVLMDYESGMLLYQKQPDAQFEPASMAKLMTIAVVFNQLRDGAITMDDEFFISDHAWRDGGAASGGSTMFAELNSKVAVKDLITSVIVQSGNDAAIALAEGIAGSEATFANMENRLAEQIGLTNSYFVNATGLPDPAQHMSARDLGNLARYLIREFPQYYPIFSIPEFTWNKIKQPNRNALIELGIGVDGLKTGHIEAVGYGSVVSTQEGGRRLIAVLQGMKTMKERTEEGRKLLLWGARSFDRIPLFPKGKTVAYADVYGGEEPQVPLVGSGDIDLFVPKGAKDCPQATVTYQGPLRPPVEAGTQVAQLNVICNGVVVQTTPLFAGTTVGEGGIVRKASDALKQLAFGWL